VCEGAGVLGVLECDGALEVRELLVLMEGWDRTVLDWATPMAGSAIMSRAAPVCLTVCIKFFMVFSPFC
jgi:hypothetical protein